MNQNGWLIEDAESDVSHPLYFCGIMHWTHDHMQAVRFARQSDAQRIASSLNVPVRVCEHGWG
jgi:hypothetical protein